MAETDLYAPAAARGHREPRAAFGRTMAGKPNDTISLARLLRLHPTSSTPHAAAARAAQSRGAKPQANSLARGRGSRRRLQQDERPAKGGMSLGTGWRAQIPQCGSQRQTCQSPQCSGGFQGVVPRCHRRAAHFGPDGCHRKTIER